MASIETKKVNKVQTMFSCDHCDYSTCRNSQYIRHLATEKHKKRLDEILESQKVQKCTQKFHCSMCGVDLNSRTTLWRHKQVCVENKVSLPPITAELIVELLKDNKNMQQIITNQHSTINTLIQNGTALLSSSSSSLSSSSASTNSSNNVNVNSTNNNNTTNNNSFNLNVFLNETCKDAMNISDFVSSVKVSLEDLEHTGKYGYIEGITNIIINQLNKLERHLRPLHCSDSKREVLYIKNDNNEWTKDSDCKVILTKAIKTIANENIKQINKWRDNYPDCVHADSKKNKMYLNIVSNSMNGLTKEEGEKNINKIISNIAKEVIIKK